MQDHSVLKKESQKEPCLNCILMNIVGPRSKSISIFSWKLFFKSTIFKYIFTKQSYFSGFKYNIFGFSCWCWLFLLQRSKQIHNWRHSNCFWYTHFPSKGSYLIRKILIKMFKITYKLMNLYTSCFCYKWFEQFPEFVSNPFYISGESFAGIYVPTLASQVAKGINYFWYIMYV